MTNSRVPAPRLWPLSGSRCSSAARTGSRIRSRAIATRCGGVARDGPGRGRPSARTGPVLPTRRPAGPGGGRGAPGRPRRRASRRPGAARRRRRERDRLRRCHLRGLAGEAAGAGRPRAPVARSGWIRPSRRPSSGAARTGARVGTAMSGSVARLAARTGSGRARADGLRVHRRHHRERRHPARHRVRAGASHGGRHRAGRSGRARRRRRGHRRGGHAPRRPARCRVGSAMMVRSPSHHTEPERSAIWRSFTNLGKMRRPRPDSIGSGPMPAQPTAVTGTSWRYGTSRLNSVARYRASTRCTTSGARPVRSATSPAASP